MTPTTPSAMQASQALGGIDLRTDPQAAPYVKHEVVQVQFATAPGELVSREGPNRYATGDALVTVSTGDRWSVSRGRFDARYQAVAPTLDGQDGSYINKPLPVLARQMPTPFRIARSAGGDLLHGKAGDWLLQYAPGDHGVVDGVRFERVYRRADPSVRKLGKDAPPRG